MTDNLDAQRITREQYRSAGNLNARIRLHQRFSINSYGWFRWVVDRLLVLPPRARILELGCGPGALWTNQAGRIPPGWSLSLSDYSPGMVSEARQNLGQAGPYHFAVLDAQHIPFPDQTLDAVIANHMLYHVPDRPRALAEVQRVLRPGGLFFAATNGEGHLAELDTLIDQATDGKGPGRSQTILMAAFSLDNGAAQLSAWFDQVRVEAYEDGLEVTEVQPLIDYIRSLIPISPEQIEWSGEHERKLVQAIEREITARGAYHISKRTGLFIAQKG